MSRALPGALALLGLLWLQTGCASLVGAGVERLAGDLNAAILDQDDPATVREGAPAYLLLLDGLIEGDPENADLLLRGASLYGTYAAAFVDDPERGRRLSARARSYGQRALCVRLERVCERLGAPFDDFAAAVARTGRGDVATLHGMAAAWAGWVQANSDDWRAIADIPRIEALMRRVLALDETWERGAPHLYLGVLLTLVPPSLGGRTDEARAHFERAIELSGGLDLMAKVLYAEQYARLVFDRELHDRLLREVLEAEPAARGLTLSNTLAQERARSLLASGDDYF